MKKLLFNIFKLSIGALFVFIFIISNLKIYSVYYAKNMPKGEGQKPELVMMIDNLDWINETDVEWIKYDIDGLKTIIDMDNNYYSYGNLHTDETYYVYDEGDMIYWFSRRFELIRASNYRKKETLDVSTINKEEIIENLEDFVEPVMEVQTKPLINLQWLFNLIYQDEFK